MKQKYQVNTFEQGQEFKSLGIMAESYFVWENYQHADGWELTKRNLYNNSYPERIVPAYSCAELGVMLPKNIKTTTTGTAYQYTQIKLKGHYRVMYLDFTHLDYHGKSSLSPPINEQHEAHAKAGLLIHLLKEKIIKPEKLKL